MIDFCWHKWSKWEVVEKTITFLDAPITRYYNQRHCEYCFKTQLEKAEVKK